MPEAGTFKTDHIQRSANLPLQALMDKGFPAATFDESHFV
jgi:hypothetical protein